MAARKKQSKINLMPQEMFATSTTGRVLTWILSTFRLIVIVIEMIVMVAFLSRFWLDSRSSDLTDEIDNKKSIITSYGTVEPTFRALQIKLGVYTAFVNNISLADTIKTYIVPYMPSDVIFTSISANYSSIQITGESVTEQSISQLLANIRATNKFSSVVLQTVQSNKDGSGITFSIGIQIQTNKGKGGS